MKAKIVAMRFKSTSLETFHEVYGHLTEIYRDEVEFLEPRVLGETPPEGAEAVLFPVLWADLYEEVGALRALNLPIIVLTTRFGVSLMFDWEAVAFLKSKGLKVFNPHSVELAKTLFKALALKTAMRSQKFLIFQDTDYDGLIPEQFKIFYWWHESCTRDIYEKFGIRIVRKPYKALCEKARPSRTTRPGGRRRAGISQTRSRMKGRCSHRSSCLWRCAMRWTRKAGWSPAASTASTRPTTAIPRPAWPGAFCIRTAA
jgi:hypothetical protein